MASPQTVLQPCGQRLPPSAGSARTVNRRYIAMFVAKKDRTWASSLFVSLSAVGMAAGPLLSLPLSHISSTRLFGAPQPVSINQSINQLHISSIVLGVFKKFLDLSLHESLS